MEAYYLAQAAVTASMMLAPEIIVFGGGVCREPSLVGLIEAEVQRQLGGYLTKPPRVVRTTLEAAGLIGAFLLVQW